MTENKGRYYPQISVKMLLRFMVSVGILTEAEFHKALTTGQLPDDIMIRLGMAKRAQKN